MRINEKIKDLRKMHRLSADDAAKALGISRATLYRYESGNIEKIPINILNRISELYGVSVSEILGLSSERGAEFELDDFAYAMYDESRNFSEEDKAQLLTMARYISSKNKK